ncbi:hypothetical protein [Acinetobacter sp. ANC 4558]|nr:hypothetical protein [Acinetobacter sp. ANC 4558]
MSLFKLQILWIRHRINATEQLCVTVPDKAQALISITERYQE